MSAEPMIYLDFVRTCQSCGGQVNYSGGVREPHPCPEDPAVVVSGCGDSAGLPTEGTDGPVA